MVKMLVFGQQTFLDLCQAYGWQVTTFWVNESTTGQISRPTHPYTSHGLQGSRPLHSKLYGCRPAFENRLRLLPRMWISPACDAHHCCSMWLAVLSKYAFAVYLFYVVFTHWPPHSPRHPLPPPPQPSSSVRTSFSTPAVFDILRPPCGCWTPVWRGRVPAAPSTRHMSAASPHPFPVSPPPPNHHCTKAYNRSYC